MRAWIERLARNIQRLIDELRGKEPDEPTQPDQPAPPPSTPSGLTGRERGFVWKPISEHGTLVVLLPEPFTGKTERRIALERNGSVIAESNRAHNTTPQPNGNREHYRFPRKGGDYAGPLHVRVRADGATWRWSIPSPSSRYDNLTASKDSVPAPSDPAPTPPPSPTDIFRYEPGATSTKVTIPRAAGVWKFTVLSLSPHHYIVGPHNVSANVVTVPHGGAELGRMAVAAGGRGPSLLIHANTSNWTTGPHRSVSWRIPDPTKTYLGDATRVRDGEKPH